MEGLLNNPELPCGETLNFLATFERFVIGRPFYSGVIYDFVFTDHALKEMARREIVQDDVKTVLAKPDQIEIVRDGRAVYQSKIGMGQPPRIYLLRVFVDIDPVPPYVVTVYRTSKIEKYWR